MIDDLGSVTSCIGNAYETINLVVSTVNSLSASSISWDAAYTTVHTNSAAWFNTSYLYTERAEYGESISYTGLSSFTPDTNRMYVRKLNKLRSNTGQIAVGDTSEDVALSDTDGTMIFYGPATYLIEATAPHRDVGLTKLALINVNDAGDILVGSESNSFIQPGYYTQGSSTAHLIGYIEVPASPNSKTMQLVQYISNKTAYTSLAQSVSATITVDGSPVYLEEIFSTLKVTKVL